MFGYVDAILKIYPRNPTIHRTYEPRWSGLASWTIFRTYRLLTSEDIAFNRWAQLTRPFFLNSYFRVSAKMLTSTLPHKTIRLSYVEFVLKIYTPPTLQANLLKIWTKLTSGIMWRTYPVSTPQNNTFNIWTRLTCSVSLKCWPPHFLTKQYVHRMNEVDMLSPFWKLSHLPSIRQNKLLNIWA